MTNKQYNELIEQIETINSIRDTKEVLSWDQQVIMPEKGIKPRSMQLSTLSRIEHQLLNKDELKQNINSIQQEKLSSEQKSVVREIQREQKRASKTPENLIKRITEKQSNSLNEWRKAKKQDDYQLFKPHLEEMVELKKKYAENINPDIPEYQVLYEDFEPYITLQKTDKILQNLKEQIKPLINSIEASEKQEENLFKGNFPEEKQKELIEEIAEDLGYKEKNGRVDESEHPFTAGNQYDCRVTVRYHEDDLEESISSLVHEVGHAFYQLGLPQEEYGNPLGRSRELAMHESQSRLWENHILKSKSFAEYLKPKLTEKFPEKFKNKSADQIYRSLNTVNTENPIRVKSDEITYQLHIILRYELERKLIEGSIDTEELPDKWDEKMEEYFGFSPESDSEGVLQDAQWAHGAIGYFPTYTLGNLIAAQLNKKMREEIPEINKSIAKGEFKPVREWLKENIHQHGQRYKTQELIKKATGSKLSEKPFLEYIENKYSRIYNLD